MTSRHDDEYDGEYDDGPDGPPAAHPSAASADEGLSTAGFGPAAYAQPAPYGRGERAQAAYGPAYEQAQPAAGPRGGSWRREAAPRRGRGKGFAIVSALLAGIAFVGFIWYSYSGGGRGALGVTEPPLIQADQSPFKIRPEQPGGLKVPHQDKLVFDRLNPGAVQQANKVERLLPPPEAPMPRPEPPPTMTPAAPPAYTVASNAPPPVLQAAPVAPAASAPQPPVPVAQPQRSPAVPVPQAAPVPTAPKPSVTPNPVAATPAPQVLKPPPVQTAPSVPASGATAATGKTGSFAVQLASVRSESEAQSEWKRLQGRFPSALGNLGLAIKRADLGPEKGVYFRVQGGSVDEARARAICSELKAQNVGCQLVRPQ
ncbi:MAG TPA: SPOR domain-containing protein [Azospirillaceae bacterium]|nr:SPOR domain-containing protein [Azospirillaceae bacterium]